MKSTHRQRKAEPVRAITNLTIDWEWSQSTVRKLLWRSSGLNVASIKEDHITHFELLSWGVFPIVVERHVILQLGQSRLCFLQAVCHPIFELIDGFHAGPRLVRFKAHLGDMSGVEEERRVLSGRMNLVVVLEFREWQEPHPIISSLVGEKSEILFQFLVDPFRLSISLWVVGGGGCQLNSE